MVNKRLQTLHVSGLGRLRGESFQVPEDAIVIDAYFSQDGTVAVCFMGTEGANLAPLDVQVLGDGDTNFDESFTHLRSFEDSYHRIPVHVFYRFPLKRPRTV